MPFVAEEGYLPGGMKRRVLRHLRAPGGVSGLDAARPSRAPVVRSPGAVGTGTGPFGAG
jgi:hypothetical protein